VTDVRLTHIGGPTVLIEVGGWRLLTDPTFDAPGRRYRFGWGTGSRKLAGPAVPPSDLGRIDAILLEITATPCRHGPPLSRPLTGDVIGFALRWEGQEHGQLWISGDTVLYDGVREVARRVQIDTSLLHLGGVQFPVTGPVRYTMTAKDAVELCDLVRPRTAIPIHYEGWKHFRQGREAIEREFASAPDDIRRSIRWLPIGEPVQIPSASHDERIAPGRRGAARS
jgi:L-ascorbate metabolism protein UlaG (beta-lactamase superfamily)